jgi:hypothetical protein
MLQTERSRDRVPTRRIFLNLPNPSSRTMALGSTQPVTEIFIECKGRPTRSADKLTAVCEPVV